MNKKLIILGVSSLLVFLGAFAVLFLGAPKELQSELTDYSDTRDTYSVKQVSVYVQDLSTGETFGVNENALVTPASLFKIPFVMTYLHDGQSDPSLLDKKITYTEAMATSNTIVQDPPIERPMSPDQSYAASDLIERIIVDSENAAAITLRSVIPPAEYDETLSSIGVQLYDGHDTAHPMSYFITGSATPYVSMKSFSRFLASLYDASYLDRAESDKLIALLDRSDYTRGLISGIPSGIRSAHKFGVYTLSSDSDTLAGLNDCAIVYAAKPYTICVAVIATDMPHAEKAIKEVSKIAYKHFK